MERKIGRPPRILVGYQPKEPEIEHRWSAQSPAGRIILAIRQSGTRKAAASWGGISHTSLNKWLRRGRDHAEDVEIDGEDRAYVVFVAALTRAEAANEVELVAQWKAQAGKDWRAAKELLAHRHPEGWGPLRAATDHGVSFETEGHLSVLCRSIWSDPVKTEAALALLDIMDSDRPG
jgi:hypothetical protein